MNPTAQLQTALKRLGFDPGPIDGAPGPLTTAALRSYQIAHHLLTDGIAGPATLAALRTDGVVLAPVTPRGAQLAPAPLTQHLPWLDEAERLLGLHEGGGSSNNPVIMSWADALGPGRLGTDYTGDDIPWCGLFMGHCISVSLPAEPLPAILVRAGAWASFGMGVAADTFGAVGVFSRPGGNHVGILVGKEPGFYYVLGGNTGDSVKVAKLAASRLTHARWPSTVRVSTTPLPLVSGGVVSLNER